MKKIYLLISICLFSQFLNAQSCNAPEFTSQQQLDNFKIQNPGCKTISGSVFVSGADITNLNGLSNITHVMGDVTIINNPTLPNMSGLGALTDINGRLTINNNPALLNVDGLGALTNIYNGINVEGNQSLTDLSGLQSLSYVNSYLRVVYNPVLTSVEVFNKITSVTDFLSVGANPMLESLSGLRNITTANSVSIALNDKLLNLDGLKSLTSTTGYLYIGYNPLLTNLQGLGNLKNIGYYLNITNNNALTSLTGLDSLELASQIQIQNNPNLSECAIRSICAILNANAASFFVTSNATGCNTGQELATQCAKLPIDLVSFSGESKMEGNVLKWVTASEINNKGFEVEKSSNGKSFQKIGFVKGSTDSWRALNYSFTDPTPHSLTYYRLKQIDWDGTSTYSKMVVVQSKEPAVAVYPNPSRGRLSIRAKNQNQPYYIKDGQGIIVKESPVLPDKEISTESLQDGIYFLTVGSEVFKILVVND
ncbi:T9SS type A sorting domain-containing protein [Dyadobacter sp. BHUBP1]|uniref:T9SS type A sorting domain-containing protein n=1 Tax=Dyadobacter sp. BHUBP1 TaxID=3424178 RepID=UPI003D329CB4